MEMGYVVYVPGKGYLADLMTRTRSAVFNTDVFDAMIFDHFRDAQLAQAFVCWALFDGKEQVSIHPFPDTITIGG